jgi:hypothetical protein
MTGKVALEAMFGNVEFVTKSAFAQQILHFIQTLSLCIPCNSHNKQPPRPSRVLKEAKCNILV